MIVGIGDLSHHNIGSTLPLRFRLEKFEPLWDFVIRARPLARITPWLKAMLSPVSGGERPAANRAASVSARGGKAGS